MRNEICFFFVTDAKIVFTAVNSQKQISQLFSVVYTMITGYIKIAITKAHSAHEPSL